MKALSPEAANSIPRVLIVEDDTESIALLRTLFERKGYEVVGFATNGSEAFKKYQKLRPDIVTMDIMMPSVDGRTCTKNILEFDPKANIVVVSVLGHEELETLKSLGVKAFIKKPIDIDELFDAIINISVSIVKDEKGEEMGAVGMASAVDDKTISSGLYIEILRHDILNPLGLIKNFAELLSDESSESTKPHVEAIIRNADRLIELVDDASKLSKIDKMKRLGFENLEVSRVIDKALEEIAPQLKSKRLKVENKVKDRVFIEANALIGEALLNLLSNAVKYSPEGGKVTVEADEKGGSIVFSVKDQGPGVPNEYKNSIFKRLERRKKQGVKGTGLGLSLVKKIVELHNGDVWVEDNPNGGSVFKVRIPKRGS